VAGIVLTGFTDPPALIPPSPRAGVSLPEEALAAGRHPGSGASSHEHVYQTRAIRKLVGCLRRGTDELDASLVQVRSAQFAAAPPRAAGHHGSWRRVVHDLRNLMVSLGYVESVLEQRHVAPT